MNLAAQPRPEKRSKNKNRQRKVERHRSVDPYEIRRQKHKQKDTRGTALCSFRRRLEGEKTIQLQSGSFLLNAYARHYTQIYLCFVWATAHLPPLINRNWQSPQAFSTKRGACTKKRERKKGRPTPMPQPPERGSGLPAGATGKPRVVAYSIPFESVPGHPGVPAACTPSAGAAAQPPVSAEAGVPRTRGGPRALRHPPTARLTKTMTEDSVRTVPVSSPAQPRGSRADHAAAEHGGSVGAGANSAFARLRSGSNSATAATAPAPGASQRRLLRPSEAGRSGQADLVAEYPGTDQPHGVSASPSPRRPAVEEARASPQGSWRQSGGSVSVNGELLAPRSAPPRASASPPLSSRRSGRPVVSLSALNPAADDARRPAVPAHQPNPSQPTIPAHQSNPGQVAVSAHQPNPSQLAMPAHQPNSGQLAVSAHQPNPSQQAMPAHRPNPGQPANPARQPNPSQLTSPAPPRAASSPRGVFAAPAFPALPAGGGGVVFCPLAAGRRPGPPAAAAPPFDRRAGGALRAAAREAELSTALRWNRAASHAERKRLEAAMQARIARRLPPPPRSPPAAAPGASCERRTAAGHVHLLALSDLDDGCGAAIAGCAMRRARRSQADCRKARKRAHSAASGVYAALRRCEKEGTPPNPAAAAAGRRSASEPGARGGRARLAAAVSGMRSASRAAFAADAVTEHASRQSLFAQSRHAAAQQHAAASLAADARQLRCLAPPSLAPPGSPTPAREVDWGLLQHQWSTQLRKINNDRLALQRSSHPHPRHTTAGRLV
ncbi:hypothetical protein DIPPA_21479 [Diplonema papillatum]|nr:hypothetical protein DIPPA_21479 [Diplonema papillatum]